MDKLSKEVCDTIENHDYLTYNLVAEMIDGTKDDMSKFHTNKRQLSFRKFLRLSYVLHPDNQKEVFDGWCLRFNTTEAIKQSFEYASITRNKELLKTLIDKYSDDSALSKHVAIYTILYDFYTNEIRAKDLITRLDKVGQLKGELVILSDIIKCYNYYWAENYSLMLATAKEAEKEINKLGDRQLFIKECYLHRVAEVLGHVSRHLNDIDSARFYANLIINADICAKTVAGATYILGMSYLPEDKEKAIKYLQIRYDITKTLGEQDIENNARRDLDFAKLYLDIQLDADADPILLRLQNNEGSEFELKLIREAVFQGGDDEFLVFLCAMAKNSLEKMHECRKYFFKRGNYFFTSMAAREAKKLGESSALIEEFIEIKTETKGDVEFEENFIKCFNRVSNHRSSISA
ncbi:hypothetical protein COJ96_05705 [Bacillus sp. AFS073361]|uniref:AimR family lysis-lysogeny pheromone receptor n=1 Tax=Bacillus sp. AFS073361 TaxID=2033511 RepID=UPI000BF8F0C2|nr:AimR family lysis-lysogeny pheromone receptor [Bacillus sp. AFS073361]PFP30208.1 hypothetical protein COJ96_05705 [Bacillus sp. AFS073361]